MNPFKNLLLTNGDMNTQPKKSIIKRFWWIFVIIIVITIILVIVGVFGKSNNQHSTKSNEKKNEQNDRYRFGWPSPTAKYVTAVPVDLNQIQSVSKYRSCAGHVRDGYNFDRVREYDRSMKHYFYPVPEFQGTLDKVKVFAPFDGTITYIDYEKDKVVSGRTHNGGGLHISPSIDSNVTVVLGHIYTVKDYKVGDQVKAGELVGYASLGDKGNDFDTDLTSAVKAEGDIEVLGSIFDHMTPEVLAEFAKYGLTPENTKFSKEYRDIHPCGYYETDKAPTPEEKAQKLLDTDGHHNENHVQLVKP